MARKETKEPLPIVKVLAEGEKKAEGYGKLAPVFLEGAEFALFNHHWISVEDDLPYNHKDLMLNDNEVTEGSETRFVFIVDKNNNVCHDCMIYKNGKWGWKSYCHSYYIPVYWFPMPSYRKE